MFAFEWIILSVEGMWWCSLNRILFTLFIYTSEKIDNVDRIKRLHNVDKVR